MVKIGKKGPKWELFIEKNYMTSGFRLEGDNLKEIRKLAYEKLSKTNWSTTSPTGGAIWKKGWVDWYGKGKEEWMSITGAKPTYRLRYIVITKTLWIRENKPDAEWKWVKPNGDISSSYPKIYPPGGYV